MTQDALQSPLIGSLRKTTFVDFPGLISAAIFLHGCNFRCPYCYNKDLVTGSFNDFQAVSINDVKNHLEKRKNLLKGFVISGGEPCISPFLKELILMAKEQGYKVKLDTNGTKPEVLKDLFSSSNTKPDFVAMDIKTSLKKYDLIATNGFELFQAKIKESIEIISSLETNCREFRTVLVPPLVTKDEIKEISTLLPKDSAWRFAQFIPENCIDEKYNSITPYTPSKAEELVLYAKNFITDSVLR